MTDHFLNAGWTFWTPYCFRVEFKAKVTVVTKTIVGIL